MFFQEPEASALEQCTRAETERDQLAWDWLPEHMLAMRFGTSEAGQKELAKIKRTSKKRTRQDGVSGFEYRVYLGTKQVQETTWCQARTATIGGNIDPMQVETTLENLQAGRPGSSGLQQAVRDDGPGPAAEVPAPGPAAVQDPGPSKLLAKARERVQTCLEGFTALVQAIREGIPEDRRSGMQAGAITDAGRHIDRLAAMASRLAPTGPEAEQVAKNEIGPLLKELNRTLKVLGNFRP